MRFHPNKADQARFLVGRENGTITMFRAALCQQCQAQMPKGYLFCSEDCQEAYAKARAVQWIIDLNSLKNGRHSVETKSGTVRNGRITNINFVTTLIDGREVAAPISIEMDDETSDYIEWQQIKSINRS